MDRPPLLKENENGKWELHESFIGTIKKEGEVIGALQRGKNGLIINLIEDDLVLSWELRPKDAEVVTRHGDTYRTILELFRKKSHS